MHSVSLLKLSITVVRTKLFCPSCNIEIEMRLYVALSGILMDFALDEITMYPPLAFFLEGYCTAGTVSYLWSARAVG
jgi:hypothetical protein